MPKLLGKTNAQIIKLSNYPELALSHEKHNLHLWLDLQKVQKTQEILVQLIAQHSSEISKILDKNIIKAKEKIGALQKEKIELLSLLSSPPVITSDSLESFFAETILADKYIKLYFKEHNTSLQDYKKIESILEKEPISCILIDEHQRHMLEPLYRKLNHDVIGLDAENWHIDMLNHESFINIYKELIANFSKCINK
jgi:ABC-type Zn uptake system ZnuABC Zn-binding protein ZnuA